MKRILAALGIIVLALLGLILVLGLLPLSSRGMASEPDPATTYDEAVARFQQAQQAEAGVVNDASSSHLLVHGERTPRVYVMVHGITNSPLQWLELGQTLYDQGHNVVILRMPYHGLQSHHVGELKALKPHDLRTYADQAVDIAAGLGDEVVVVGISGGGTVAAWMAENRAEVDRTLLLAPFFGVHGVPGFLNTLLMNAFSRLPNIVLDNPLEPQRDWVYRGEATRGVAAFLALGRDVVAKIGDGVIPGGQMVVLTTANDDTANNQATAAVVDRWRQAGVDLVDSEFEATLDIPHNSVDPAADAAKKQLVYDRMLELLGEPSLPGQGAPDATRDESSGSTTDQTLVGQSNDQDERLTMTNSDKTQPAYVTDLQAAYGKPSQEAFGSAVFFRTLGADDDLEQAALEIYQYFVGELWERWGEDAWMGPWKEVHARKAGASPDVVAELRGIDDRDAAISVPMILDVAEGADTARAALSATYDDPSMTELRVFNTGDGAAMSGLLIAGRRTNGEATFLAFLLD